MKKMEKVMLDLNESSVPNWVDGSDILTFIEFRDGYQDSSQLCPSLIYHTVRLRTAVWLESTLLLHGLDAVSLRINED